MRENTSSVKLTAFHRNMAAMAVIWTLIGAGSLTWDIRNEGQQTRELAKKEAEATFNKDQALRFWATKHGGVYVQPTDETPPNPYLIHIPDRDIRLPSGKRLTLMNPAYILRQVMSEYETLYGVKGHITSLKLLNSINKPDEWEQKALESFERGEKEVVEFQQIDEKPYLRLIRPMVAKKGCLKCHGFQGYEEGDIRGGVGVSVPMAPYLVIEKKTINGLILSHMFIWIAGIAGVGLVLHKGRKNILHQAEAEKDLLRSQAEREAEMRESESRFRKLFNTAAVPLCFVNKDGVLVDFNERFVQTFGYTHDDVPTLKEWWQLAYPDPDYRKWVVATWDKAVRKAAEEQTDIKPVEYNVTCKNGQVRTMVISGTTLGDNFLATFFDITERKQLEEEIRRHRDHLEELVRQRAWEVVEALKRVEVVELRQRSMLEHLPVGVVLSSGIEQKMLYQNPRFRELFGYTIEQFPYVDKWWSLVYPDPDYRERVAGEWNRRLAEAIKKQTEIEPMEVNITAKDGTVKFIRVHAAVMDDLNFITLIDLTERKRAEEELNKLNEVLRHRAAELEVTNSELSAFVYTASHVLRAPLRGINGYSKILLEDCADTINDEGKRLLNKVSNNAIEMGQYIDDLLTYSNIVRREIALTKMEMEEVGGSVFKELEYLASGRSVKFEIKNLPPAVGDPSMIKRVFSNLLKNSIKFTRGKEVAFIEVGGWTEENENIYYVKDNGVGFDMQHKDNLFAVFQRLHGDEEFEGTGMGLALVKRIIEKHGGRVWAEGKVNEGATFYFTLPKRSV